MLCPNCIGIDQIIEMETPSFAGVRNAEVEAGARIQVHTCSNCGYQELR